ncbi:MAG: alanine racemase [Magnetococcales bacterium]|nr:alanine racemase [Magnetococcales bacterium]
MDDASHSFQEEGRPDWVEVDLPALVDNFRQVVRRVGEGVRVWPVVKANAYGLGALPVARALQRAGAAGFCVALVEEGEALRAGGVTAPLMLLSGPVAGNVGRVLRIGAEAFLITLDDALALAGALPAGQRLRVHLKVDTGMGRLGMDPEQVPQVLSVLDGLPGIKVAGIASHLAVADEVDNPGTLRQIERMKALLAHPEVVWRRLPVSMANSAGIMAFSEAHFQWVRPGIHLYGGSPFFPAASPAGWEPRPVVRWCTRVIQVRNMAAGTPLGYGHTVVLQRPSRIGQLPVGYADGYPRILSNRAEVIVGGRRVPVLGRVCMDLVTVDLTDCPDVGVGDEVVLLGGHGPLAISLQEMSAWMGTIPYEVLCRLGARVPRRYREFPVATGM